MTDITDADIAILMQDERCMLKMSNIILQRLLKEANAKIAELESTDGNNPQG